LCSDVVEKLRQERGVEILDPWTGGDVSKSLGSEAKQKPKGVAVAGARVRAGAKLSEQPIRKEPLKECREDCGGHGITCLN